jgi:hypothetical protein
MARLPAGRGTYAAELGPPSGPPSKPGDRKKKRHYEPTVRRHLGRENLAQVVQADGRNARRKLIACSLR